MHAGIFPGCKHLCEVSLRLVRSLGYVACDSILRDACNLGLLHCCGQFHIGNRVWTPSFCLQRDDRIVMWLSDTKRYDSALIVLVTAERVAYMQAMLRCPECLAMMW